MTQAAFMPRVPCIKCGVNVGPVLSGAFGYPGKRFCPNCGMKLTFLTLRVPCPQCGTDIGHMFFAAALLGQGIRYCYSCGIQMTGICGNAECGRQITVFQHFCEHCGTENPFYFEPV